MFGSRNDDEKVAKRRVWSWGRRDEQGQSEEVVEQPSEAAQADPKPLAPSSDTSGEGKVAIDVVPAPDEAKTQDIGQPAEQVNPAPAAENQEGKLGLFARMRQKFEKQAEESAPEKIKPEPEKNAAPAEAVAEEKVQTETAAKPADQSIPQSVQDKPELAKPSQQPKPAVLKQSVVEAPKPEPVVEPQVVVPKADTVTKEVEEVDSKEIPPESVPKQPSVKSAPAEAKPEVHTPKVKQQEAVQVTSGDVGVFGGSVAEDTEQQADEVATGGFFAKMRKGLSKTRNVLVEGVTELFIGKKEIDDELLEELETQLLVSDVGVEATTEIIEKLTERVKYRELDDADALIDALKAELRAILEPADKQLIISEQKKPYVILVVGVNGVGKTTTIGKLASRLKKQNKSVMLAAGDTFRAAAVEQLQVWGERNRIPVVAQHSGADSASVVYDAFEAAKARGVDVLIADTAGRLHNKEHLMEELKKIKRVLGKLDADAPHEVLLVMDAGTGQNALSQAKLFHESVGLTGMALTKLDGTAKGGVIFALSRQMQLPIRFLGVGEQIDDLRPFAASEFVEALFDHSK